MSETTGVAVKSDHIADFDDRVNALIAEGGGSTPRLDQVLDPTADKTFAMGAHALTFGGSGNGNSVSFANPESVIIGVSDPNLIGPQTGFYPGNANSVASAAGGHHSFASGSSVAFVDDSFTLPVNSQFSSHGFLGYDSRTSGNPMFISAIELDAIGGTADSGGISGIDGFIWKQGSGTVTGDVLGTALSIEVDGGIINGDVVTFRAASPANAGTVNGTIAGVQIADQGIGIGTATAKYGLQIKDQSNSASAIKTGLGKVEFGNPAEFSAEIQSLLPGPKLVVLQKNTTSGDEVYFGGETDDANGGNGMGAIRTLVIGRDAVGHGGAQGAYLFAVTENGDTGGATGAVAWAQNRSQHGIVQGLLVIADSHQNVSGNVTDLVEGVDIIFGSADSVTDALVTLAKGIVIHPCNSNSPITTAIALSIEDQIAAATNWSIKTGLGLVELGDALKVVGNVGFFNHAPAAKPTITGSRGGNAALASLLTAFAGLGLLTDSTT